MLRSLGSDMRTLIYTISLFFFLLLGCDGNAPVQGTVAQAVKGGLTKWKLEFSLDDLLTSLEAALDQWESTR